MRKLASIQKISKINSHPNADSLELAYIQGWQCVVKKGQFNENQLVCWFEIDSLIPRRPWSLFLFKDEKETYRLRSIRLRGQLSQGLLIPIAEIPELAGHYWEQDDDLTELLKIEKWEMPIPAQLAGQIKGNFPNFLRKTDEIRLQSAPAVLDEIKNVPVYVSIKCDGTSMTAYKYEGVFGVCSRNLELKEEGGDSYWMMAKALDLPNKIPDGFAVQGELVGPGIQGNKMGLKEKHLFIFNVFDIVNQRYLDFLEFNLFCSIRGLETVVMPSGIPNPIEGTIINKTIDEWLAYAESITYPNGSPAEGIVVRPVFEQYSAALDSRLSFKVISNKFLLKYGE